MKNATKKLFRSVWLIIKIDVIGLLTIASLILCYPIPKKYFDRVAVFWLDRIELVVDDLQRLQNE